MMNQRKRSILFLLFTAGLFAGVLFCTETTQAKVKVTVKNGVCTVSGKGAMTKPKSYNQKIDFSPGRSLYGLPETKKGFHRQQCKKHRSMRLYADGSLRDHNTKFGEKTRKQRFEFL